MTPRRRHLPQPTPKRCDIASRRGVSLLVFGALALLVPLTGCERIRGALEDRRELTAEQQAIQAYSDATDKVNAQQQRFVQAWERTVKNEEVTPLKTAVEKDVIPALTEYLGALRKMPTSTAELERIHAIIVGAYEATLQDLQTFVTTLSEENRKEPVDKLIARLSALSKAEEEYRKELKSYYEKHNITLIQDKQETGQTAGGAAGTPKDAPKPRKEPPAKAKDEAAKPTPAPAAGADAGAGAPEATDAPTPSGKPASGDAHP